MNVLILGGTGFLSSAVVEACVAAGHTTTVLTRGQKPLELPNGVQHLSADRNDKSAFAAVLSAQSFDLVVDCICFTAAHARQNLDVFAGRTKRLVMISTDFVYGGDDLPLLIPETAPRHSASAYGRAKAEAEDILLAPGAPLAVTILRPPHIVGKGGVPGTGSLQGRDTGLRVRLERGEPLVLLDGGALLIQPADRRDIAAACLAVSQVPDCAGHVYNMVGPRAVTTRRYYEILAEELGLPLKVLSMPSSAYCAAFPDRLAFARHRAYDTSALARDACFQSRIPLEHSLREMLSSLVTDDSQVPSDETLLNLLQEHEEALVSHLQAKK